VKARRILSVPVTDELHIAVRLAATKEGVTVAAWARQRLLNAVRRPEPHLLSSRASLFSSLRLLPRVWTVTEAASLLALSRSTLLRQIRAGYIDGYREPRTVFDPGRQRWLRRIRWMIPGPALFAYLDERATYELKHGRRLYTPRANDQAMPASATNTARRPITEGSNASVDVALYERGG